MVEINESIIEQPTKQNFITQNVEEGEAMLSDTLILHHSDMPGLTLVNTPLDGRNYGEWSHSMRLSLSVKNKLGLIDGTMKSHQPPMQDFPYGDVATIL